MKREYRCSCMCEFLVVMLLCGKVTAIEGVHQTKSAGRHSYPSPVHEDRRTLDEIHAAALAEGGHLTIYAGGDSKGTGRKVPFETRFPGMKLNYIVDLSKFHDGRIDNQLATNTLIPDIVQLQTVQDFPSWKSRGVFLNYKPIGWSKIYPELKDKDGAYTGVHISAFGTLVNTGLLPNSALWPYKATSLLNSRFKSRMVGTWPNDDDAVLFWYKLMVDKYGWTFIRQLTQQNITMVRGTGNSHAAVDHRDYQIGIGIGGPLVEENNLLLLTKEDPFVTWAQTAGIFKASKHPEAAKLYMSWALSEENQRGRIPIRNNIASPTNLTIWDYKNTNPLKFAKFMGNRQEVELFKTQITLYFGEVIGECPTGYPGVHPTQSILP